MNIEKIIKENDKRIEAANKKIKEDPNNKYVDIARRGIKRLEQENKELKLKLDTTSQKG